MNNVTGTAVRFLVIMRCLLGLPKLILKVANDRLLLVSLSYLHGVLCSAIDMAAIALICILIFDSGGTVPAPLVTYDIACVVVVVSLRSCGRRIERGLIPMILIAFDGACCQYDYIRYLFC